ncbi:MAG: hypothetical protein V3V49_11550 [Candidatus Krumholzibacteria bacterium]
MNKEKPKKRGRQPEHVNIDGDWQDAVDKALKKERPKEGWPEKPQKKRKPKRKK